MLEETETISSSPVTGNTRDRVGKFYAQNSDGVIFMNQNKKKLLQYR